MSGPVVPNIKITDYPHSFHEQKKHHDEDSEKKEKKEEHNLLNQEDEITLGEEKKQESYLEEPKLKKAFLKKIYGRNRSI